MTGETEKPITRTTDHCPDEWLKVQREIETDTWPVLISDEPKAEQK